MAESYGKVNSLIPLQYICSQETLREAPVLVNHRQSVKRDLLKRQIVDVLLYIVLPSCRICALKCADTFLKLK
jgi:hypothetical protein